MSQLAKITLVCAGPVIVMLSSCEGRKPQVTEKDLAILIKASPELSQECIEKVRYGGFAALPDELAVCYQMLPAREWHGIWGKDFELSRLCSLSVKQCSYDDGDRAVWLDFAADVALPKNLPEVQQYRIEFVGRMTAKPGGYGHMNQYHRAVQVDKLLSITPIK